MWIGHNGMVFNMDFVKRIKGSVYKNNSSYIGEVTFVTKDEGEIVFAIRKFPEEYYAQRFVANVLEIVKAYLKAVDVKIEIAEVKEAV
ncbi:hypothetical protein cpu_00880 [Carboxydothermus pertinax]|uniref:Uncharacterized protein n=2 Tax=Carboxydothermus pertinax TaxID=870242 RepID=A0A1L8CRM9_9THEO|nr:hypothetical protein cpu_00880 [Carboxydothermus pertinax]